MDKTEITLRKKLRKEAEFERRRKAHVDRLLDTLTPEEHAACEALVASWDHKRGRSKVTTIESKRDRLELAEIDRAFSDPSMEIPKVGLSGVMSEHRRQLISDKRRKKLREKIAAAGGWWGVTRCIKELGVDRAQATLLINTIAREGASRDAALVRYILGEREVYADDTVFATEGC